MATSEQIRKPNQSEWFSADCNSPFEINLDNGTKIKIFAKPRQDEGCYVMAAILNEPNREYQAKLDAAKDKKTKALENTLKTLLNITKEKETVSNKDLIYLTKVHINAVLAYDPVGDLK